MFPQEPHRVPGWMADLAAVQEAADRFDPDAFTPQRESDLEAALPDGLGGLFEKARATLRDYQIAGAADRFLVGLPRTDAGRSSTWRPRGSPSGWRTASASSSGRSPTPRPPRRSRPAPCSPRRARR